MNKVLPIALLIAAIAFALGPFTTPEFGGFDPALYPIPQDDPPVVPAGYAFAIWGVIYIWLVVLAAYSLLKRISDPEWKSMRLPLLISLVIGVGWLPVALKSPIGAEVMILSMLVTAVIALTRAPSQRPWIAREGLAIYAGWLTAASFAGLGLIGAGYGLVLGEPGWAWTALLLALLVCLFVHSMRPEAILYPAAVAWAVIGIGVKNLGQINSLSVACFVIAAGLLALSYRAFKLNSR